MRRVSEFARLKGISRARAYQLVHSGALPCVTLRDGTILLEESAMLWEPRRSRPLSERMAWLLLHELAGQPLPWRRTSERERVRQHIRSVSQTSDPARRLAELVSSRAVLHRFTASPDDLSDLRADERFTLSGVGAPGSGMMAGGVAEGYVRPEHLAGVKGDYLLADSPDANVLLRVSEHATILPSVIAADLADWGQAREVREANTIIRRLLSPAAISKVSR